MSLNVRLSEEEARMAAKLRKAGVQISALVREAIRSEYERRIEQRREVVPSSLVRDILDELHDAADLPSREFATTDRHAVRRHVAERLSRRR
jgi:hypothetical protein